MTEKIAEGNLANLWQIWWGQPARGWTPIDCSYLNYPTGRPLEKPFPTQSDPSWIVRPGCVIYTNCTIGKSLDLGHHTIIREECQIGDGVSIWSHTVIDYGCVIGYRVKIHCNCYLAQYTTVEDDVFIGPGVITTNDIHPVCTKCMQGPIIKKGARVGAGSILLPRIIIGEQALIGAGSVVTRDVPARAVVYGNPARQHGTVDEQTCPPGLVDQPYLEGQDVRARGL